MTDPEVLTYPVWLRASDVRTLLLMNLQTGMGDDIIDKLEATPNAQDPKTEVHQMLADHKLNKTTPQEVREQAVKQFNLTEPRYPTDRERERIESVERPAEGKLSESELRRLGLEQP